MGNTFGRRKAVALATMAGAAVGLSANSAQATPSLADSSYQSSTQPNAILVTTALQVVFNEHRVDQIDQYFSADFVQHSPLVTDPGREGLKGWLSRILQSIPDLRYTTDQLLVDKDRVVAFATVTGTIVKDMPEYGIKATGQQVNIGTAHIFRVSSKHIAEHWEVVDTGQLVMIAVSSPLP